MCICIVGFHWMKTDFICRQNGVILISRSTCYVRWEIGVEGQDWKLFDMHMVGCFHMLMQPAWLTFSPSSWIYAGGTHIAVCQPVPHPSLHSPPPLPVRPTLHISTPLILFFFPFVFCFCSVNISQEQSSRVFLPPRCRSDIVCFQPLVSHIERSDSRRKQSQQHFAFVSLTCRSTMSLTLRQTENAVNLSFLRSGSNCWLNKLHPIRMCFTA